MKRTVNSLNILNKYKGKIFFIVIILLLSSALYSSIAYNKWGIPKGKVMEDLLLPEEKTYEFTPSEKPEYENKIMNMVNLILKNIDSDVYKKIKIISTKADNPRRDFLLFNNKLFSVKEYYKTISKENLDTVIKALSKQYGEPNHNPGTDMDIYFISSKETKIIVHYFLKTKSCEIYFYDSQLYHKLSSNEF